MVVGFADFANAVAFIGVAKAAATDAAPSGATVAQYGFAGTIFLGLVTLSIAVLTNRTEKKKVADVTVEAVLRERILMKDEKIKEQDEEIEDLKAELEKVRTAYSRGRLAVDETRAEERAHLDERRTAPDA